ncbi:phosphotransferase [Catenuloplanes japonicus]|uniref:phosphotransferase n=1 Tax=Catenuloplanes japonicus TaxID=33876 RepID=UPI00068BF23B|nr:phosphotransferase [Catenuloplanes japonicus]
MTTVLTAEAARELARPLRQVCAQLAADPARAALIKYTMNAVYRVGPYVIRLGRGTVAAARARVTCSVTRSLVAAGVPFVRLAVDHPVYADDWVATIWHYVDSVSVEPQPVDLVGPLHAIHALAGAGPDLPVWDPIGRFQVRIEEARQLAGDARTALDAWARAETGMPAGRLLDVIGQWSETAGRDIRTVQWAFPRSVIHGDAHTGNLLLRSVPVRPAGDPTALICDPDGLSDGHREWDYAAVAHGVTRFGRSRPAYDLFAAGAGFDVTTWTGWPTIARIRELQLVTAALATSAGRPAVATELGLRVRSLLNDDDTVIWSRHT